MNDKSLRRGQILSVEQREAFVIAAAFRRRNLSPSQKKDLGKKQKKLCKALRKQDVKQWTQAKLASMLGVSRVTVLNWLKIEKKTDNDVNTDNANPAAEDTEATDSDTSAATSEPESPPDARVTIPATEHDKIFKRFLRHTEKDGWSAKNAHEQIAADYGASTSTIKRIVTKKRKQFAAIAADQASADESTVESFIYHGDFREAKNVEPNSIDLILTDPPYDEDSISLYGDLAAFAVTPEYAAKVVKSENIASADLAAAVRRGTDRAINNELGRLVYARSVEGQGSSPNRRYRKVADVLTSYRKRTNGVADGNGTKKS